MKDGVDLHRMPRIAAEPFMRVVGEMLDLEEDVADKEIIDADVASATDGKPSQGGLAQVEPPDSSTVIDADGVAPR